MKWVKSVLKGLFLVTLCILSFAFGVTWDVEYRKPYYEAPGYIRVEQKWFDLYFVRLIPSPGFAKHWPEPWDLWDVGRISKQQERLQHSKKPSGT